MTLTDLNIIIEQIATNLSLRYFYGELNEDDVANNESYPAMIQGVTTQNINGQYSQQRNQFGLQLFIVDTVPEDPSQSDWKPKYESTHLKCTEALMQLVSAGDLNDFDVSQAINLNPIRHWENTTSIVGWEVTLIIEDRDPLDCDGYVPPAPPNVCESISEMMWAAIKDCMSEGAIEAATEDLCTEGCSEITLTLPDGSFAFPNTDCEISTTVIQNDVQVEATFDEDGNIIVPPTTCAPFSFFYNSVLIEIIESPCGVKRNYPCDYPIFGVILTGQGSPETIGIYLPTGVRNDNGLILYLNGDEDSYFISFDGSAWSLFDNEQTIRYYTILNQDPWEDAWVVNGGDEPAPTPTQATISDVCLPPDIDIMLFTDGDLQFSGSVPAVGDSTININLT